MRDKAHRERIREIERAYKTTQATIRADHINNLDSIKRVAQTELWDRRTTRLALRSATMKYKVEMATAELHKLKQLEEVIFP